MAQAHAATAEDNLNVSLKDITVTQRDGRVTQLDQVYIRGPMIRLFIVPDMLSNAPMCVRVLESVYLSLALVGCHARRVLERCA